MPARALTVRLLHAAGRLLTLVPHPQRSGTLALRAKTEGVVHIALFRWGEFEKRKPAVLRSDIFIR